MATVQLGLHCTTFQTVQVYCAHFTWQQLKNTFMFLRHGNAKHLSHQMNFKVYTKPTLTCQDTDI